MSSNKNSVFVRRRIEAVTGLMAVGIAMLGIRAVDLHWIQGEKLQQIAERQHYRQFSTVAPRGQITDRNGRTIAESIEVPSIAAIGSEVPSESLPKLAKALGTDTRSLKRKLAKNSGFVWLARQIDPTTADAVVALELPGVRLEKEWRRYHPLGPETGHLLGFVGIDGKGLEGIEYSFNDRLSGIPGIRQVQRDARGRSLPGGTWLRPEKIGEPMQLYLDAFVQSIAYAALAEAVLANGAKGGSVVVMRPEDGSILAMANWPGFNPNNFKEFRPNQWRNRAITDVYEPGSTLKPFTVAAALASGRWKPESRIDCENGKFEVADHTIHDDHPEQELDMAGLIARSSNIGAAKLALDIGVEPMHRMLTSVGLSRRSGVGLSGESPGIMPPTSRWGPVETANIAFGQGIAVTPLQLATAFCVLANGGLSVAPRLVMNREHPMPERVMPQHVANEVMRMLEQATSEEGTGGKAVPAGYRVAGKTGTAQKPGRNGNYSEDRYTALFAGAVPANDPEIVIAVVIDEPQKSIYGGQVAAPVFRDIAAATLPYLGVSPELERNSDWSPMPILATAGIGRPNEDAAVPQMIGLSLRQARRVAVLNGYELKLHGSGWVVRQKPSTMASLPAGSSVEVWLDE